MIASLKNVDEVEVEITMTLAGHRGSFVLLEGEDDSRFWEPRVASSHCEVVIGGCKATVTEAIRRLDQQNFKRAVAVIDDDCDRLRGLTSACKNVVYTDARDLEGVLLRSSALSKVLAEFGVKKKIEAFEAKGETVRDGLLKRAALLGRLRWLSADLAAGVNFEHKSLKIPNFLDTNTWSFDDQALLDAVDTLGKLPLQPQLQIELSQLSCGDLWQVCQGHDLVAILGYGLEKVLGDGNPGPKHIGRVLRAGIEPNEFAALQLYQDIKAWEVANPPYQVLR